MKRWEMRAVAAVAPLALATLTGGAAIAAPAACPTSGSFGGIPGIECTLVADNGFAEAVIRAQGPASQNFGLIDLNEFNGFDPVFRSNVLYSVNGGAVQALNSGVTSAIVDGNDAQIDYATADGLTFRFRHQLLATRTQTRFTTVARVQNQTDQPIDFSLVHYTDLDLFCPLGCAPDINPADDLEASFDDRVAIQVVAARDQIRFNQDDTNDDGDRIRSRTTYLRFNPSELLPTNLEAGTFVINPADLPLDNQFALLERDDFVVGNQTEFVAEDYLFDYSTNQAVPGGCIPAINPVTGDPDPNSNAPIFDPDCVGPDFAYAAQYLTTIDPGEFVILRWNLDHVFRPAAQLAGGGGLAQVPAPAPLALLAIGLIAVAAVSRRRRA